MTDDAELLDAYVRHRCEAAFNELLQRHAPLVYSTALRRVSDPQCAHDVVQLVFIELAQKPKAVRHPRLLAAWLYQVTRRVASNLLRSEARRRQREQHAVQMNPAEKHDGNWTLLEPHLEEAIDSLRGRDQDLIVLRFFERRSLRDVGQALAITEDAAQKRLTRALEQLRHFFERRGIRVGATALAGVISANAVPPAPTGLVLAIAAGAATAGTVATLAPAAKLMTMTAVQKSFIAVGLSVAVGIGVYQHRKHSRILEENSRLQEQTAAQADSARGLSKSANELAASPNELDQARALETARLRAEAQRLRGQLALQTNGVARQAPSGQQDTPTRPLVKFSTRTSSPMKPGQTLITRAWPGADGNQTFMLLTLEQPPAGSPQQLVFRGTAFEMTDQTAASLGLPNLASDARGTTPSALLDLDESGAEKWIADLKSAEAAKIVSRPRLITKPGDEATLFIGHSVPIGNGQYAEVGRTLKLLPVTTEQGITVSVNTELTELPDAP